MRRHKKALFLGGIVCAILIAAGLVIHLIQQRTTETQTTIANTAALTANYHTLKPSANPNVTLQPLQADQAFAFDDRIAGTPITVSQQPLPQSFKANPASSVAALAQRYSATTKITTGSTIAYTGHSASNDQTTIFTKDNVLVFITSKELVSDQQLASYIAALN